MLRAAKGILQSADVTKERLRVIRVPGAFEIPVVAAELALRQGKDKFDGIIGLGVILQGITSHAEHIGSAVTQAFVSIQVAYRVPIIHEVLVFASVEQARERCLSAKHNRGAEAATTALEMARVMRSL
ncbi:MAG: 6,7-dimethyl-8-ribityllumazine synthase [Verrucomicrobia subdivision 3 bacterium]|nr:6,7-dimethyl-8-ribityllumazine synthase [Limisphaerales bacterium]MCS1417277.1 6,7-dimethyl-8-ribityllumazine synthase [Limisphaerales bacterium]